jgi:hypothetical protein
MKLAGINQPGRIRALSTTLSVVIIACASTPAQAAPDAASDEIDADKVRCEADASGNMRAGYWSQPFDFVKSGDLATAAIWARGRWRCPGGTSLTFDGVVASEDLMRQGGEYGRVREAYASLYGEDWSLRAGRQIVIWGRADRLNPTDVITPRDYTRLVPEETEQRDGVDALAGDYRVAGGTLTALLMAGDFRGHDIPLDLPDGLASREVERSAAQVAMKYDRAGAEVDWSVSALYGYDLPPSFELDSTAAGTPLLKLHHPRLTMLGADMATVVGRYGLRAELAYSRVDQARPQDPLTRQPMFYLVAGGERTYGNYFNVNLQLYWKHTYGLKEASAQPDPMRQALLTQARASWDQTEADQVGLSLRLANKWLNETVEAELAGVYALTQRQYALRPRLIWHVNDRLKLTLGADLYGGDDDTNFGLVRDLSTIFMQGQIGF